MNIKPIAGIDVGKFFSEMVILSPSNELFARMRIHHDSNADMRRAIELTKKSGKGLCFKALHRHGIHRALSQNPFPLPPKVWI